MANFIRRIVSGNKARFKDTHLDIELDLVYVTDTIIIMGFPATGVEGLYRNHRDDAKRFLEHRHGKNYWVFNFCPVKENSYPVSLFDGRVSRYPFPDHHAPPLAILPLAAREMCAWLSGSPDRVIVLHCKAGKGRSGTLACAYLLSLDDAPSPPRLQRNLTKKEWAKNRADQIMEVVKTEDMSIESRNEAADRSIRRETTTDSNQSSDLAYADVKESNDTHSYSAAPTTTAMIDNALTETPPSLSPVHTLSANSLAGQSTNETKPRSSTILEDVIALHTSRRMKAPSTPDKKLKQGVSIPSQRRWLYYWSLILAHAAPPGFWSISNSTTSRPKALVRLLEVKIRMRELGGVKMNLIRVADKLLEKSNNNKSGRPKGSSERDRGKGLVWVSLARYNDELVETLEKWERHTRHESGDMGKRRRDSELNSSRQEEEESLRDLFSSGKWDKGKMVRSFARLGDVDGVQMKESSENGPITVHTLRPLSDKRWEAMQTEIEENEAAQKDREFNPLSTASSVTELNTKVLNEGESRIDRKDVDGQGIVLDAERELRAKLYIGSVFMGWFWFIPTFHMPQPPPSPSAAFSVSPPSPSASQTTHFVLTRKELDFPLGAGSALIDVDVALEWVTLRPGKSRELQPPKAQTSQDSSQGVGGEPDTSVGPMGVIAAGLQAAVSDATGREAVEVVQASDQ